MASRWEVCQLTVTRYSALRTSSPTYRPHPRNNPACAFSKLASLPVTSSSPISPASSQQHKRRPSQSPSLACQPESRTAKLCRLPVARARPREILRSAICRRCSCLPPRLPAQPRRRNLHTMESLDPPSTPKYSKSVPDVEKARNAPAAALQPFFDLIPSRSWP